MASGSDSSIEILRKAINSLRPDEPTLADRFTHEDLQRLVAEGFQSVGDLKDVSKAGLRALGLPTARVSNIKPGGPNQGCVLLDTLW